MILGNKAKFLFYIFSSAACCSTAMADQAKNVRGNEIFVYGIKPESILRDHSGQAIVIEPNQASRFDALSHIQRESSMTPLETGQINPTGATVPRIRAHDSKLTEIYVEDLPLQNPYGGLPLIDSLDLRAFGTLEIYQGVSPYDIPGSNPSGTLRYRFRQEARPKSRLGVQGGKPYGLGVWGLLISRPKSSPRLAHREFCQKNSQDPMEIRLFGRQHQTDGHYMFYSDEGTPYNTSDDRIVRRTNNDQRSFQLMPTLSFTCGPWNLRSISWLSQSQISLPTLSARVPSQARGKSTQRVISVGVSRTFDVPQNTENSGSQPTQALTRGLKFDLKAFASQDEHQTTDPYARYLVVAESSRLLLSHKSLASSIHFTHQRLQGILSASVGETTVKQNYDLTPINHLERDSSMLSLGFRTKPFVEAAVTLEAKKSWRDERSKNKNATTLSTGISHSPLQSQNHLGDHSLGIVWSPPFGKDKMPEVHQSDLYFQAAQSKRLPTLYEEFGNGSNINPNTDLLPEKITHREMGLRITHGIYHDQTSFSAFRDTITDKIIFVPIYANASKALNIRNAEIEGFELRTQWTMAFHPLFPSTIFATYSRLMPMDKTREPSRIIPGIPEKMVVGEWSQKSPWVSGRWVARYRSDVFRDVSNDVYLPGTILHDGYVDTDIDWPRKNAFKIGLMVRNIFDVIDLPIKTKNTGASSTRSVGRTALSDLAGSPLPGRQWVLSMSIDLF